MGVRELEVVARVPKAQVKPANSGCHRGMTDSGKNGTGDATTRVVIIVGRASDNTSADTAGRAPPQAQPPPQTPPAT